MSPRLTIDRQIDNHGRDLGGLSLAGGDRFGSHDYRPADRQASNGRQDLQARRCLTHVSPCITYRGLRAPVFSHSNCSLRTSRRCLSDRQRAGANPLGYRLSAAFIPLRVLGRSRQFRLVQHVTRQSPDAHKGHVVNASLVRWFNVTEPRTEATRKNGNPFQHEE